MITALCVVFRPFRLMSSFVRGQESTMYDIVWMLLVTFHCPSDPIALDKAVATVVLFCLENGTSMTTGIREVGNREFRFVSKMLKSQVINIDVNLFANRFSRVSRA